MRWSVRCLMGVCAVILLTAGPAGAAGAAPARSAADPTARAMWLWSRSDPATVISWATSHGVTEIFSAVPWNVAASGDLPRLRDLKIRADAAGISLAALGGEPEWVFNRGNALTWQRDALATGLFARTHLDVEPYALNAWHTDQAGTANAYLQLLDEMQAADPRPLEADVPFWYSGIPTGVGNLADEVLARVDAVTVMSYRDTATGPNSLAAVSTDMLIRGAAAGKSVRLAVETAPLPDCPHCTFYEEGEQRMRQVLADATAALGGYPALAGFAVHHYTTWTLLRP